MKKKSKIFFDHLPKTGGTSIVSALRGMTGSVRQLDSSSNNYYSPEVFKRYSENCIAGHMWFSKGSPLMEDYFFCSILRDPIDRFLSQFYFNKNVSNTLINSKVLNHPHLQDHHLLASYELSLEEYLFNDSLDLESSYANVQARHFASRVCDINLIRGDDELAQAAIEGAQEYDLIGSFERVEEFIDSIANYLGCITPKLPSLNKNNLRPRNIDKSSEIYFYLNKKNKADFKLIEWANNYFNISSFQHHQRQSNDFFSEKLLNIDIDSPSKSSNILISKEKRSVNIDGIKVIKSDVISPCLSTGDDFAIVIEGSSNTMVPDLIIGIAINNRFGELMYGINTQILKMAITLDADNKFSVQFHLKCNLGVGLYSVTVGAHIENTLSQNCCFWKDEALVFSVLSSGESSFHGPVNLEGASSNL